MSTTDAPPGSSDTIIAIPRPPDLEPLLHDPGELPVGDRIDDSQFKIRLANTEGRRSRASYLIRRRYEWRGYSAPSLSGNLANRITLAAFDKEQLVATISVGVDST